MNCLGRPTDEPLNIAVAANMQFAAESLRDSFVVNHPMKMNLIIGSSGKLASQIMQGAPFDLLLSADPLYPQRLIDEGQANGPAQVYAYGSLVAWSLDTLALESPSIRKVALGNPKTAPYGKAARQFLERCTPDRLSTKQLVYGESISQVIQFIRTGSCDIGLVAKSAVFSGPLQGIGFWTEIPAECYDPIEQAAVVTKYGRQHHPERVKEFLDFILSPQGQGILENFGYAIPKKSI